MGCRVAALVREEGEATSGGGGGLGAAAAVEEFVAGDQVGLPALEEGEVCSLEGKLPICPRAYLRTRCEATGASYSSALIIAATFSCKSSQRIESCIASSEVC